MMTLNKLFFEINQKYPYLIKSDLYELIFYLSTNVKHSNNIPLFLMKEIDFDYQKLKKLIDIHYETSKPISRIIGFKSLDNVKIELNDQVFCPREETFEWCSNFIIKNNDKKIASYLDLCTGSGFIPIILNKNLEIEKSLAIDVNPIAIRNARENAILNNVEIEFVEKSVEDLISDKVKFDLITCNPPYINIEDPAIDFSALLYDPKNALFAKHQGLYFYELIISKIENILNLNGTIIFEIGYNQKKAIEKILNQYEISDYTFHKDFNKNWRSLIIQRK